MNIYAIGVIISIIVYILVGNYAGSKVEDLDDYYVSGRQATTFLITGTLIASMLSTNGFMGDTGFSYSGHITLMIIINTLCSVGYVLGPLFFGRYIRRMEVLTMPQYFGERFESERIRKMAGATTVVSLMAYLIAVTQGTALLMSEMTEMNYTLALFVSWVCFTSFTFYSGSSGVILTDTMMFMVFLVATILAGPYISEAAGGAKNIIPGIINRPHIDPNYLSYHGMLGADTGFSLPFDSMAYAFTMGIVWLITVSVSPWQAGRNLMAKNEHVTYRSGALATVFTVLFLSFLYIIALAINLINPDIVPTEQVIIWACLNILPKIIAVVVLTGVMAAGLSSASTFLSVAGFSFTNDLMGADESQSEEEQLKTTRLVVLGVGFVSLLLALFIPPNIRIISWFASTIIAASWGLVAFMSVWSKKITEKGAFFGMLGGFIGFLLASLVNEFTAITLKNFLHPFFIGIIVSFIAMKIGDSQDIRTDYQIAYFKRMHTIPEAELDHREYKIDKIFATVLVLAGLVMMFIAIKFWAIPYMTHMGTL